MAKKNTLKQQYQKERRRVQSLLRRYRKKYYSVEVDLPTIPKRITQGSIRRLQKITPDYVRKRTYDVDYTTGESIPYSSIKPSPPKPKEPVTSTNLPEPTLTSPPKPTLPEQPILPDIDLGDWTPTYESIVLQNFFNQISSYPPKTQELVRQWYAKIKSTVGEDTYKLIDMLQEGAENGLWATYQEAYNSNLVMENLSTMLDFLDISGGEKRTILDELAQENDYYEEFS